MKALLVLSCLFSMHAYAETCKVENYKDAIACIKQDAYKRYGEGEMPHSVGATKLENGKLAFTALTGKVSKAEYVGVVEVHYDEDQIMYYEIDKGESVTPVLVKEFNSADMGDEVPGLSIMEPAELLSMLSLHIPLVGSMVDFHFN